MMSRTVSSSSHGSISGSVMARNRGHVPAPSSAPASYSASGMPLRAGFPRRRTRRPRSSRPRLRRRSGRPARSARPSRSRDPSEGSGRLCWEMFAPSVVRRRVDDRHLPRDDDLLARRRAQSEVGGHVAVEEDLNGLLGAAELRERCGDRVRAGRQEREAVGPVRAGHRRSSCPGARRRAPRRSRRAAARRCRR